MSRFLTPIFQKKIHVCYEQPYNHIHSFRFISDRDPDPVDNLGSTRPRGLRNRLAFLRQVHHVGQGHGTLFLQP